MRRGAALALFLGASLLPAAARPDGAFPDELRVYVPAGQQRIVLATNFGLIESADDGASWRFVCEGIVSGGELVRMYQLAADGAILGVYGSIVAATRDSGCSWNRSTGLLAQYAVIDVFPDPGDGARVLAIGSALGGVPQGGVFESTDGAASFGKELYAENAGDLSGVEIAASDPRVVYVSGLHGGDAGAPTAFLARSADSGQTWTEHPQDLGTRFIRIAAVDPADPDTVYLRAGLGVSQGQDAIWVTHDGGLTAEKILDAGEPLSAFVRAGDGSLYAGARSGSFWRRAPGASAFEKLAGPQLRCLGERGGALYACGDNWADGYALAKSDDRGQTWKKLVAFDGLGGLLDCAPVKSVCAGAWSNVQQSFGSPPPPKKSCGCGVEAASAWALLALVLRRPTR